MTKKRTIVLRNVLSHIVKYYDTIIINKVTIKKYSHIVAKVAISRYKVAIMRRKRAQFRNKVAKLHFQGVFEVKL